MEVLQVVINDFMQRSGSVEVRHSDTPLTRGLEPGERVILVSDGKCWLADVVDLAFDLTDTTYRFQLATSAETGDPDNAEVIGMLADLRDAYVALSSSSDRSVIG